MENFKKIAIKIMGKFATKIYNAARKEFIITFGGRSTRSQVLDFGKKLMKNMDFNNINFYSLSSGQYSKEIILQSTFKDNTYKIFEGDIKLEKELLVNKKSGIKFYDFLFFDDGINFVISEKVYNLLVDNSITGWSIYKVLIHGTNHKYYGFQINGRSGELILPKEPGFYMGYKFDFNTLTFEL